MTDPVSVGSGSSTALVVWDSHQPEQPAVVSARAACREQAIVVCRAPRQNVAGEDDGNACDEGAPRLSLTKLLMGGSSKPNGGPLADETPATEAAAAPASDPHDWVAQSAAMQRSLAELSQKAAVEAALLKLKNDLNDATVSAIKQIGSSIKAASQ